METVKGPDRNHDELLISLVDQYQSSLLRLCFIYLHDKALAEDAVQETFLKAYKSLSFSWREQCKNLADANCYEYLPGYASCWLVPFHEPACDTGRCTASSGTSV